MANKQSNTANLNGHGLNLTSNLIYWYRFKIGDNREKFVSIEPQTSDQLDVFNISAALDAVNFSDDDILHPLIHLN